MYLVLVGPISTQVEVTGKLSLPMSLLAFADMHLELFLEVTIGRVELDPQSLLAAGDWKILTDLVPKLDININLVQLRLDRVGRILSG
jgi:predicted ATP-dependent Lon-type protease